MVALRGMLRSGLNARFNRRAIDARQTRGFKSNAQTQVVADVAVDVNTKSVSKSAEKYVRAGAASRRCASRARLAQGVPCARSAVILSSIWAGQKLDSTNIESFASNLALKKT